MKILLVGVNFSSRAGERSQALAPYYLKSYSDFYLPDNINGILIKQFLSIDSDEEVLQEIVALKPDIIGFSVYIWNINKVLGLCEKLKKRCPLIKVILGGPEVSSIADTVLRNNPYIDIIVRDEGERTFHELLRLNFNEGYLSEVLGITYRKDGLIFNNPSRPLIEDLSEVSSPFLTNIFPFDNNYNVVHFETSRGCIFSCKFCCWASKDKKYIREYPLERIFKELFIILNNKAVKGICFCDSNIFFNNARAKKIFTFLVSNNSRGIPIFFELNAEFLDDELIGLIKKLKTNVFSFGIQSVNRNVLETMGRRFIRSKFEENIKKLRNTAKNAYLNFDLIYGLPTDTLDGFKNSINYILAYKPNDITFFPLLALPGSDFFNNADKYGLSLQDGPPHKVLSTNLFTSDDMLEVRKIGLFIKIVLRYKIVRDYFYLLSLLIYRRTSKIFYLEPILRFSKFIEFNTNVLAPRTEYCDLSPASEEDNERLKSLLKKIKSTKIKLMWYLVTFSYREFGIFLRSYPNYKR